jgi:hypothetical protein
MNSLFVCACGKEIKRKIFLELKLELIKVFSYDFPHLFDGSQNSRLFSKGP